MNDKEILSELKICYELLTDINDNEYKQIKHEDKLEIRRIIDSLAYIYDDIRTEMSDDECEINIKGETYLIGHTISEDYNIPNEDDYITCGDLDYYWYWEELEKSSRGNKNENITDKVVEIEDYYGNTIMAFETNKYGKIIKYDNCDIADIDSDYIFDTDKDLMRIQEREKK